VAYWCLWGTLGTEVTEVQCLGLACWSSGSDSVLPLQGGAGSIPGQGAKVLHAGRHGQNMTASVPTED